MEPIDRSESFDLAARRASRFVENVETVVHGKTDEIKLVLSAHAAVAELYAGERLRFEFARTTSRLIEMQSHAYLARPHRP